MQMQNYTEQYSALWDRCSTKLPDFSKSYNDEEKLQKELVLDQFLKLIKSYSKERSKRKLIAGFDKRLFLERTREFLHDGLDFTESQLEMMFSDELIEVSKSFVRKAKAFDRDLSFHDIFQACRNVWIMNGLQLIMGIPMQLTDSIFAYSMLYPYSDNIIDDPNISGFEKMVFSERFRDRLSGVKLEASSKTETAIFRLVEMIEEQYSRVDFPEVFESLLGIHEAQTRSLTLIHDSDSMSYREVLKICLTKGGASVVADGYLVAGHLTEAQRTFLFGYGAYLQLLDDIQDVDEDYAAGLMTVFSGEVFLSSLDEKLNKTYWFGEKVMESLEYFNGQHIELFKSLMRKSMDLFIIEAIAQTPDAYSPEYITDFETYSPFHFSYICKRKEQFMPYKDFLITVVEEIAFTDKFRTKRNKVVAWE